MKSNTLHLLKRLCAEGQLTFGTVSVILVLKVLATLVEGVGLGMMVPVLEMAGTPSEGLPDAARTEVWQAIAFLLGQVGLSMTVENLLLCIVLLVLLRQCLVYAHRVVLVAAQQRMVATLRTKGVAAGFAAAISYHDQHATGALVNDLAQETQRSVAVAFTVVSAAGNLVTTSVLLTGMIWAAGWAPVVVFAGLMMLAPVLRLLLRRTRMESEALANANRSFSTLLVERLRAIRLLKLTQTESREEAQIGQSIESARSSALALVRMQALIPLIMEPAGALLVAVLFYGGVSVLNLPLAIILIVIGIIFRLLPVIQEIAKAIQVFFSGIGSMVFVVERFDSARLAKEEAGGNLSFPPSLNTGIRFHNVVYRYPVEGSRTAALKSISLQIAAGKLTAIVGPSGAGKSTLIDLIPKLRLPDSGHIEINNQNLLDVDTAVLRQNIAFVSQSPRLVAGSIRDHINFGAGTLSQADLVEAATLAGLHDFISELPDGYDTQLGEDGAGLSGGQRQRLDLARAIARKSPILVLDEPASNLDPESAKAFRETIRKLRDTTDTTIILIAHHFASITDADHIIIIDQGEAVAAGTHDELMAQNAWYKRACVASDDTGPAAQIEKDGLIGNDSPRQATA